MSATVPRRLDELTLEDKRLLSSSYGFAKYYLGMTLCDQPRRRIGECRDDQAGITYYEIYEDDWQKRMLDAGDQHRSKVTACTSNGAGKTSKIIPGNVLPFMALNPRAKVVITSGVDRQVREQVFPHLNAHVLKRLPGWDFSDTKISAPNGSHCVGFTTREGGHFEGWHGNPDELYKLFEHDGPLMIVVDEAKSVQKPIFDAIERCTYQRLLLVSSAGAPEGEFYESQTKARSSYTACFQIPASLCPHADHAKNLDLIRRRGLQDPLVRSKVFAEFMVDSAGAIISRSHVEALRNNPPVERRVAINDRAFFCDFAAGGDENTIGARLGNKLKLVAAWRETDTMKAVGQFILEFRKLGLNQDSAHLIYGDNDGLGRVMIDRLHEMGWRIQRWSNGDKANREEEYRNRGTEMWYEGAKKIEKREYILEVDELTASQLCGRRGYPASDGRLAVESKEDLRKRLGYSPDRAEAILGAAAINPVAIERGMSGDPSPFEQFAEMRAHGDQFLELPAGIDAGY